MGRAQEKPPAITQCESKGFIQLAKERSIRTLRENVRSWHIIRRTSAAELSARRDGSILLRYESQSDVEVEGGYPPLSFSSPSPMEMIR